MSSNLRDKQILDDKINKVLALVKKSGGGSGGISEARVREILTDYYTKEEIGEIINNLPSGEFPTFQQVLDQGLATATINKTFDITSNNFKLGAGSNVNFEGGTTLTLSGGANVNVSQGSRIEMNQSSTITTGNNGQVSLLSGTGKIELLSEMTGARDESFTVTGTSPIIKIDKDIVDIKNKVGVGLEIPSNIQQGYVLASDANGIFKPVPPEQTTDSVSFVKKGEDNAVTSAFRLSNTASDATIKFNVGLNEFVLYSHAYGNNVRAFSRECYVDGFVNSAFLNTTGLEGTNGRSGFQTRYLFGFEQNGSSSLTRLPITGTFSDSPGYADRKVLAVSVNNVQADLYGNINLVPDLQEITDLASDKTITDLKSNNKNVIVTFSNITSRQTIKLPNPATHKGKTLTVINNTEYSEPNSDIDLEQSSTIKFELARLIAVTLISNGTTWIMIGRNNVDNPTHIPLGEE